MLIEQQKRIRQGDQLYERYGRPLEVEHWGKYVVIVPDGKTTLGDTPLEAMQKAKDAFGPGGFVFKVGEKVVYRL